MIPLLTLVAKTFGAGKKTYRKRGEQGDRILVRLRLTGSVVADGRPFCGLGPREVDTVMRRSVGEKAHSMKDLRPLVFGGVVGIVVALFAGIRWSFSVGHLFRMWSYILISPVWLVLPCPDAFGPYASLVGFVVVVLVYALAGWLVGAVIRIARRYRKTVLFVSTLFVVTFCLGYVATWAYARDMVRSEIMRQRDADYQIRTVAHRDKGVREPQLQIMACTPICPFVVACEYDYVVGGFDGWGKGSLWFWRGRDVKEFFTYVRWSY